MDTLFFLALGLAAAGVVYALVRGVLAMASGRDLTGRQSNNFMWKRVMFQGAALLLVALFALAHGRI